MSRHLYTPRLADDLVRALYREGQRRRMPMTRLLDELVRSALSGQETSASCMVADTTTEPGRPDQKHP